jgi:hypothetical protein
MMKLPITAFAIGDHILRGKQADHYSSLFLNRGGSPRVPLRMLSNNDNIMSMAPSSSFISNSATVTPADVLSTQDIAMGTILAFILSFGYSYLNGQSSTSNFVSWAPNNNNKDDQTLVDSDCDKTFNADNWKEISREENYVLYSTRIRQSNLGRREKKENKSILLALLVLFVPIFSIEFFFALSRQFVCEMGLGGTEFVHKLCSPINI